MTKSELFFAIVIVLISARVAEAQGTQSTHIPCATTLPAGLVIRVEPDEKIVAGETDGPLLLTVTSDVRLFPGKPPIVPRSSKVFAKTVESTEAGRLWGTARYQLAIETILTPDDCQYELESKLIDAGKYEVDKGAIVGAGHARRDFVLWLFPPTTLYQFIRLPARGPKLKLDEESSLAIRLIDSVPLEDSAAEEGGSLRASTNDATVTFLSATECADRAQLNLHNPLQLTNAVVRPFRNVTPYVVTLTIGKEAVIHLGPCFGSMVTIPMGEFPITAHAIVLEPGGQREVPVEIIVNAAGTGWDIINRAASRAVTTTAAGGANR